MKLEFEIDLDTLTTFVKKLVVEDIEIETRFDNRDDIITSYLHILSNYTNEREYEEITDNLIKDNFISIEQAEKAHWWSRMDKS